MNPVIRKPSKRVPRAMCLGRAFLDRMPCPLSVNSVQREAQQRGRTIARMHDHRHPWTSCRDWPIIVRAGSSHPEDHSPDHCGLDLAGGHIPEREPDNDRLDRARGRASCAALRGILRIRGIGPGLRGAEEGDSNGQE